MLYFARYTYTCNTFIFCFVFLFFFISKTFGSSVYCVLHGTAASFNGFEREPLIYGLNRQQSALTKYVTTFHVYFWLSLHSEF